MQPLDLVDTARRLLRYSGTRRPRQADLKRSISTAYYAVFHAMCRNVADAFVGSTGQTRLTRAWTQAYRAVDHSYCKEQCSNRRILGRFPDRIQDFANAFVDLQILRHRADYQPDARFTRTETEAAIETAERSIRAFRDCTITDRRAFAVWVSVRKR